jgi:hypothetical protein
LKAKWQDEFEEWTRRSLADRELVSLWADGVYVKAGLEREKAALLVVIGAMRDGRKEVLAVVPGYRESKESWLGRRSRAGVYLLRGRLRGFREGQTFEGGDSGRIRLTSRPVRRSVSRGRGAPPPPVASRFHGQVPESSRAHARREEVPPWTVGSCLV